MPLINSGKVQARAIYLTQNQEIASRLSQKKFANKLTQAGNSPVSLSKKKGLLTKITGVFGKSKQDRSSRLCGLTIHPAAAEKFTGKVCFNGTGEVLSVNKISEKDYNILLKNRIRPLNETPVITSDKCRTPGEVMINFAALLRSSDKNPINKNEIEELIKRTWLDGALTKYSALNVAELIKMKTINNGTLSQNVDKVTQSLEDDFYVTKRNDNYYGRLFETELADYINSHPTPGMERARDKVSAFLLEDFYRLSPEAQKNLCQAMQAAMRNDPPSWRTNLPEAVKFLQSYTQEDFISMMKFKGENSIPLILSTAVKYITTAPGLKHLLNTASEFYTSEIIPQRQLIDSFTPHKNLVSNNYGLLLPYQSSPNKNQTSGKGIRPIDKYVRPTAGSKITQHDAAALNNERTIGIGMSGSANILHFLFRELQQQDNGFPLDDAKLATAAWLSYSGGHSFNEVYSVFDFMSSGNFKPLSFNKLAATSELGQRAVDHAYNKVIDASIALRG